MRGELCGCVGLKGARREECTQEATCCSNNSTKRLHLLASVASSYPCVLKRLSMLVSKESNQLARLDKKKKSVAVCKLELSILRGEEKFYLGVYQQKAVEEKSAAPGLLAKAREGFARRRRAAEQNYVETVEKAAHLHQYLLDVLAEEGVHVAGTNGLKELLEEFDAFVATANKTLTHMALAHGQRLPNSWWALHAPAIMQEQCNVLNRHSRKLVEHSKSVDALETAVSEMRGSVASAGATSAAQWMQNMKRLALGSRFY